MKCENRCKYCDEQVDVKDTRIDHVIPLAAGGSDDDSNLQNLCQPCHLPKTQIESLDNEHVVTSATESPFNSVTLCVIISDGLCNIYTFKYHGNMLVYLQAKQRVCILSTSSHRFLYFIM